MGWFLYDNGLRHERVKCLTLYCLKRFNHGTITLNVLAFSTIIYLQPELHIQQEICILFLLVFSSMISLINDIFVWWIGESDLLDRKDMRVINPMIFHFKLRIAVKQNGIFDVWAFRSYQIKIFSKGDSWSVIISLFSGS